MKSAKLWLVYSREHNAWWGPNHCGYFCEIDAAGRYTKAEADDICSSANMGGSRGIDSGWPYEVACIAPEAWKLIGGSQ